MTTLRITGWRVGLQKISLTKLLQDQAGLGLAAAKQAVDDVLDGRPANVTLPASVDARSVVESVRALGADCEVLGA